jgi:hypothetical protein
MSINMGQVGVSPGNFAGLASLAGTRVGNLGLESPANAYLKARGQNMQQQQFNQQMSAKTFQDFMSQQQGQKAAAQEQSNKDRDFGLKQQQMQAAMAERKEQSERAKQLFELQLNKHSMDMAKESSAQQLQATQVASFTIAQMDPKTWNDNKVGTINGLVKAGLIDEDQGKKFVEMDHNQVVMTAKSLAAMSGKAAGYQKIMGGESSGGSRKIYDETTVNLIYESQGLTPTTKTDQQKDLLQMQKDYTSLGDIEKTFDQTYLTTKGAQDLWVSKKSERLQGYPVVGGVAEKAADIFTGMDKKERGEYLAKGTEFLNQTEQFFQRYRKHITGAQAALKELAELRRFFLSGDMSQSEFKGAVNSIKSRYTADMGLSKEALSQGVDTTPSQQGSPPQVGGASEEYVQSVLRANPGRTREEVMQRLQQMQGGR